MLITAVELYLEAAPLNSIRMKQKSKVLCKMYCPMLLNLQSTFQVSSAHNSLEWCNSVVVLKVISATNLHIFLVVGDSLDIILA